MLGESGFNPPGLFRQWPLQVVLEFIRLTGAIANQDMGGLLHAGISLCNQLQFDELGLR